MIMNNFPTAGIYWLLHGSLTSREGHVEETSKNYKKAQAIFCARLWSFCRIQGNMVRYACSKQYCLQLAKHFLLWSKSVEVAL